MNVVATGTIIGDEASGQVTVSTADTGAKISIQDLRVPAGAPDARLYVSSDTTGAFSDAATELGILDNEQTEGVWELPTGLDPADIRSVLIYCKQYSVMFGTALVTTS